jgi:hypothetical protein
MRDRMEEIAEVGFRLACLDWYLARVSRNREKPLSKAKATSGAAIVWTRRFDPVAVPFG